MKTYTLDANYKIGIKKDNEIAKIVASLSAIVPIIITIISVEESTSYNDPYYY